MSIRAEYVNGIFKPLEDVKGAVTGKVYRIAYQELLGLVGKRRILVIDDEVSITHTLKSYLEGTGAYEVRTENEGRRGLAAAREFRPDLILLDILMPDMDGGTLGAQIKADPILQDTLIVFLTALLPKKRAGDKDRIIGGHPFLAKPADPEKVAECIAKHLKDQPSSSNPNEWAGM